MAGTQTVPLKIMIAKLRAALVEPHGYEYWRRVCVIAVNDTGERLTDGVIEFILDDKDLHDIEEALIKSAVYQEYFDAKAAYEFAVDEDEGLADAGNRFSQARAAVKAVQEGACAALVKAAG